jgi:hypothetical protein
MAKFTMRSVWGTMIVVWGHEAMRLTQRVCVCVFFMIEHGQEKKIVLDGLSAKEVEQQLASLVK